MADPGDIYSALVGGTPTADEQTQALIQALRGQKLVGQLGMLSGDPTLGGVGKQLDTSTDQQAETLGTNKRLQAAQEAESAYRAQQEAHMQAEENQSAAALKETIRQHDLENTQKLAMAGLKSDGTQDPSFETQAQAIAHYDGAPINVSMSRNPRNIALMARAQEIAQAEGRAYDPTQYNNKNSTVKSFGGGGPNGRLLASADTGVQHLGVLATATDNLNNTGLPIWNQIKNTVSKWEGNPNVTEFDALKKQVADEVIKFATASNAAGGSAVFDRKEVEDEVNAQQSPAQLKGVQQKWINLMSGRIQALQQEYNANVPDYPGTPYRREEFAEKLSKDTRNALGIHTQAEIDAAKNPGGGSGRFNGFSVTKIPTTAGATPVPEGQGPNSLTPDNPRGALGRPPNPPLTADDFAPAR